MNILARISDTLYHGTIDTITAVDVTKGRDDTEEMYSFIQNN